MTEDGPLQLPQHGGDWSPVPLLVLGLTTDTPINQGLGHTPQNPKLLLPGAGGSGNGPGVLPLPRELRCDRSLVFALPPKPNPFPIHGVKPSTKYNPSVASMPTGFLNWKLNLVTFPS